MKKELSYVILGVCIIVVFVLGLISGALILDKSSSESIDSKSNVPSITEDNVNILVNGYPLQINWDDRIACAQMLMVEKKNSISVECEDGIEVWFENQCVDGTLEFELDSLKHEKQLEIAIKNGVDTKKITLPTLPEFFTDVQVVGTSPYTDKQYYGDFPGEKTIYRMDSCGNVNFYFYEPNCEGLYNFAKNVMDDGTVYYTYNRGEENQATGVARGTFIVMDEEYNIIDEVRMLPSATMPNGGGCDIHTVAMLDLGHYIIYSNVPSYINHWNYPRRAKVYAAYIQEIKDDTIIFEWNSAYYPEFYEWSNNANNYADVDNIQDYVHLNSIVVDPYDNNLLLSFRHTDSIVKISRATGEILWNLGGEGDQFELPVGYLFSCQHHINVLGKGEYVFFDNGNSLGVTRIIRAVLDEENCKIIDYNIFEVPDVFSQACGSVQQLEAGTNRYLIGCGFNERGMIGLEIDFDTNEILSSVSYGNSTVYTYRFRKY